MLFGGTAPLCCAMHRPFMCWLEHMESRCGHVSIVFLGHSMQFGFGCVVDQNMFLGCFPMYWAYWKCRVCVLCVSEMHGAFHQ